MDVNKTPIKQQAMLNLSTNSCSRTICNRFWCLFQHFAAYCQFVLLEYTSKTIKEAPKMQNIKFQPNTLPILQIASNTQSFSKLLQTFLLLQIHEIRYGGQQDTNNSTCKVSAHSTDNFLFYNNPFTRLSQIPNFSSSCCRP